MSFISKILKRSESPQPRYETIDEAVSRALVGDSGNKVYVTDETALSVTTVWACVSLLSDSVGVLPIHLYKHTDNGREKVSSHPSLSLIRYPNAYTSRMELMQNLMVSVALYGNGYAQIFRDNDSRAVKLKILDPAVPQPYLSDNDDELFYDVAGKKVHSDDMIHIKGLVVDGLKGKSPISVFRENLELSMNVQNYGNRFFAQGGNTSSVIEVPGSLSEKAYDRLKADITKRIAGIENAHKPMLLEAGAKYSRINIPLDDAQFLSTRKFQKGEIASIYRIPPHMVGDLERATYSNIEQQGQEFVTYCLMPYLERIESELNRKLLRYDEQETYYFRFTINGLLRADSKSRSEFYKNMYMIGCMNANEIRQMEEMNSYEGGEKYFVQQNMTTTDNAIKQNNETRNN